MVGRGRRGRRGQSERATRRRWVGGLVRVRVRVRVRVGVKVGVRVRVGVRVGVRVRVRVRVRAKPVKAQLRCGTRKIALFSRPLTPNEARP